MSDSEMPGCWICDKCKFVLQKNILHARDGAVSADTSPINEKCPNDGQLMRPFTWREANESFYEDNQRLRADNTRLREEVEQQSLYTKHVEAECSATRRETARLESRLNEIADERDDAIKQRDWYVGSISKLTEVVKACEVALDSKIEGVSFYFWLTTQFPSTVRNKAIIEWRMGQLAAIALIHTLQSGEKKEGE